MTATNRSTSHVGKPLSPHVASWLGTFVAAGIQHAASSRDEKTEKAAARKLQDGLRMATLGPAIGFALWKIFNGRENKSATAPIVAASLIGSGLLKTDSEVDSVNAIIWLRIASSVLAGLGRRGADILTHIAIVITFYGVVNQTQLAPSMLVKMTRRFLTPPVFDSVKNTESKSSSASLGDAGSVFVRTFRGLFAYNYFLHFAAAIVSYLVRAFGSKTVKGARPIRSRVADVLVQAAKEATILNTAVSASCAILVAGTAIGGNLMGVSLMPLPLHFCAPRVRDTVYFLFAPWCAKYLTRRYSVGDTLNPRMRLLFGIFMLEGPLRAFSNEHEGYSWMIGVAFGLVKSAGSSLI